MKTLTYLLLVYSLLFSSIINADSQSLIKTLAAHNTNTIAEFNPTGYPIGGGYGYSVITTPTVIVSTSQELIDALAQARYGDVVYIDDDSVIDLPPSIRPLTIPAGVTLASGRGKNNSSGAILKASQSDPTTVYDPLLQSGGPDIRITGLRIEGHDGTRLNDSFTSSGIKIAHNHSEVDNCEIYNWPHAAIYGVDEGNNLHVHHNYIHHNYGNGQGYGVMLDGVNGLIEANYFDYHRHGIASTGTIGSAYEARYNIFGKNFELYVVDMHGGGDRRDGTNDAGDWMVVHHNTFYKTDSVNGGIHISGIPREGVWVFSNWFSQAPTVTYRVYVDPSSDNDGRCEPCAESDSVKLAENDIFTVNNKVGIETWGSQLLELNKRTNLGDFNGDGLIDIVSMDSSGRFNVQIRMAGGLFAESAEWGRNGADLEDMRRYRVADLNGDGKSDILSIESNGYFYAWLADDTASFSGPIVWGNNGADIAMQRYKLGDFNGDNKADIISFEANNNFYVWLSKDGNGLSRPAKWGQNGRDYGQSDRYRVADVNGDGRSDVVSFEGRGFYVWLSSVSSFSNVSQWGENGAELEPYRYVLGNNDASHNSHLFSFEPNGGKYLWRSTGQSFSLLSNWFEQW
ncbi:VCBS repeat-containing protein [Pleionea sp. CnH1-48]|uniref:FG-GAP repeat domain-containing protein n=1 Tax=Pleionea sp. CnH1-48 TaxID=2954494 RepID=UPI00209682D8|nr:VCBS repeat-containing protein [Pleionea sp. CnH1-48]MCO7226368.1 VCBS repeat-containing protein [Pleionea sp. CnH1-48]